MTLPLGPRAGRLLVRLPLLVVVLVVFSQSTADPDLWGHVRFGGDIVSTHQIQSVDHYSFTSDRPWVNHEWLAEVLMYSSYAAFGSIGLIALKLALLVGMLAAATVAFSAFGIPALAEDALLALLIVGSVAQTRHIRPQLFSLVLFTCLLAVLASSKKRPAVLFLTIPIMAVWANLHGGWIVGAGVLAAWTAVGMLARVSGVDFRRTIVPAALACVASGINPYGWKLWQFLAQTVQLGRPHISEWQPTFQMGWTYILLWTLVAAVAGGAFTRSWMRREIDVQRMVAVAMLGIASFNVNRLLAFFAIATVVLVGPQLAVGLLPRAAPRPVAHRPRRRLLAIGGLAAALTGVAFQIAPSAQKLGCIMMDPTEFPEPGIIPQVAARGLNGRMLIWFDWGEYVIWHLGPTVRVSIDGRRETTYSDSVIDEHVNFYFTAGQEQRVLDHLGPDYIWLPSNLEIVGRLKDRGWTPAIVGFESVVLARDWHERPLMPAADQRPRCFPGP